MMACQVPRFPLAMSSCGLSMLSDTFFWVVTDGSRVCSTNRVVSCGKWPHYENRDEIRLGWGVILVCAEEEF